MGHRKTLSDIRREYGQEGLSDEGLLDCPIAQFNVWFDEVLLTEQSDPTAMVLSTVDAKGNPDSRVVLLKSADHQGFVFFTNYDSAKAIQIAQHPYVALNLYWSHLVRQVRIRGRVQKTSTTQSDDYFASRPVGSQLSAIVSSQSKVLCSRAELESTLHELMVNRKPSDPIVRPAHWGGYVVIPDELEFWQGRDNRLHDRVQYRLNQGKWSHRRLAP